MNVMIAHLGTLYGIRASDEVAAPYGLLCKRGRQAGTWSTLY